MHAQTTVSQHTILSQQSHAVFKKQRCTSPTTIEPAEMAGPRTLTEIVVLGARRPISCKIIRTRSGSRMSCAPKRIFFALSDGQPAFRLMMLNFPYLRCNMCQQPFSKRNLVRSLDTTFNIYMSSMRRAHRVGCKAARWPSLFAPFTDLSGSSQPDRIVAS